MDGTTSVSVTVIVSLEDAEKLRSGLYRLEVRPIKFTLKPLSEAKE